MCFKASIRVEDKGVQQVLKRNGIVLSFMENVAQ